MATKPTVLPAWATDDVLDSTSGQYNVVEPPAEKKLNGWYLGEKPNRQWWNWFQRQSYLWIKYFNDQQSEAIGTFEPVINGLDGTYPVQSGFYRLYGDVCFISITLAWNGNTVAAPVYISNLPFIGKNTALLNQPLNIVRGASTLVGDGTLAALVIANTTQMQILKNDPTTGTSTLLTDAGAAGQIFVSGNYFIQT